MSITRAQFKQSLNRKLHNKIGVIPDIDGFINESVREVTNEVDVEDTIRKAVLSPDLFSGVYDYTLAADTKSDKIVDLRQRTHRVAKYNFVPKEYFDANKERRNNIFTVEAYSGSKVLRVAGDGYKDTQIDPLNATDDWVVSGNASDLSVETIDTISGNGALKFQLDNAGSAGGVVATALEAVDATDYLNQGSFFLYVYLPTAANFTSVTLRWGDADSDYWSKTVTTNSAGLAFEDGWNQVRFDWASATKTASPLATTLNYFLISFAYNGTLMTDVRVDSLFVSRGRDHDLIYYSKYPWRTSGGTWIQNSTDDNDILNADEDAIDLFLTKAAIKAAPIIREVNADLPFYRNEYYGDARGTKIGLMRAYMMKHPSQAKIMVTKWYEDRDTGGSSDLIYDEQIRHSR